MTPSNPPENVPEASDTPRTPGAMLRAAREARGLHLAVLAVNLKVPTRQLEALENDRYEAFSGPTFVRAVAQSVCRHLGLDPAPVLAGLPQNTATIQVHPAARQAPVAPALRPSRHGRGPGVSRQVLLLGLLMSLGIAALIWWPSPVTHRPTTGVVTEDLQPPPNPVPSAPDTASSSPAPANAGAPAVAPTVAPVAAPVVATAVPSPAAPVAAPAPPAAALQPPAQTTPAPADRKSDLHIAANGDTWLEVRDSRGQLVVNRLLKAGETQSVDLAPPYHVVVGRAHLVKVTLGGKDFDLAPHTKVSTARFDIQP